MRPQDSLRQSADVFEERGRVYGDAYKNFGQVMKALFPNSVGVHTVEGFNRLGVFTQIVSKIVRYANQFETGGHDDSLLDLSTYAAMLRELDAEGRPNSVARGIEELMDRGDEIARKDPAGWGGKVPCASFTIGAADAIFSDPARKATLDGFKVGPIEPEVEPVVPRREPSYFRADAERDWAAANGEAIPKRLLEEKAEVNEEMRNVLNK